jgi:hypothetical protein
MPEDKPSPVGPPQQQPPVETAPPPASTPQETPKRAMEEPPKQEPQPPPQQQNTVRRGAPQDVMVVSSPGGATATLDGNPSIACNTPCPLPAPPGRHSVSLVLPGYQIERREVTVGGGPIEMPPVVLRPAGGTLMLSSVPAGASVSVDGKKLDVLTPAQISLALGTYSITVEKDGKSSTEKVDIKSGINFRRMSVGQ